MYISSVEREPWKPTCRSLAIGSQLFLRFRVKAGEVTDNFLDCSTFTGFAPVAQFNNKTVMRTGFVVLWCSLFCACCFAQSKDSVMLKLVTVDGLPDENI